MSVSIPLVALAMMVPIGTASRARRRTDRSAWLGATETISSAPVTASAASPDRAQRRDKRRVRQEDRVEVRPVDRLDDLGLVGPETDVTALLRQQVGERGAPAPCAQHRDAHQLRLRPMAEPVLGTGQQAPDVRAVEPDDRRGHQRMIQHQFPASRIHEVHGERQAPPRRRCCRATRSR